MFEILSIDCALVLNILILTVCVCLFGCVYILIVRVWICAEGAKAKRTLPKYYAKHQLRRKCGLRIIASGYSLDEEQITIKYLFTQLILSHRVKNMSSEKSKCKKSGNKIAASIQRSSKSKRPTQFFWTESGKNIKPVLISNFRWDILFFSFW